MMWIENPPAPLDYHVAFRGLMNLPTRTEVEIRSFGASWYVGWVNEEYALEGPLRFEQQFPEYDTCRVTLEAGSHVLAVQVHALGTDTRMLGNIPPFLNVEVWSQGQQLEVDWKAQALNGYSPGTHRINVQLGWIEWCDTRAIPHDWRSRDFDDSGWNPPVVTDPGVGPVKPATISSVQQFLQPVKPVAEGQLVELYGYERDDVAFRFFLRDLAPKNLPAQGVWRRYDLGRVRLGRLYLRVRAPEGTVVEIAQSETLSHGRVAPVITLSGQTSANMDHFVLRGGEQEIFPLTPKGGRYAEVHILGDPEEIEFLETVYWERGYHSTPVGSFECSDPLLERIWETGVETYRACTEDAVIDNPTRERGQWTGDVVTVGMDIASVAYSDLRLLRRGLIQSGQGAREDGLVAGMSPGQPIYLITYAAQWVTACLHYYDLTGDRSLLEEAWPFAQRNLEAFAQHTTPAGLKDDFAWNFVDWGYDRSDNPIDIAANLHYLEALRSMQRWGELLGLPEASAIYNQREAHIETQIKELLQQQLSRGQAGWISLGFHAVALALRLDLFSPAQSSIAVEFVRQHILNAFPNNPEAPRLSDPQAVSREFMTPYFMHYVFPILVEHGHMAFVLNQIRKCWGYALEEGRTTWVEVFDPRWSHCHQWSGCPTWILSRYVLGLHAASELGSRHFRLEAHPGDLEQASGIIPVPGSEAPIEVKWQRVNGQLDYRVESEESFVLLLPDGQTMPVTGSAEFQLEVQ